MLTMTTRATTIIVDFNWIKDGCVKAFLDEADGPVAIGQTVVALDAGDDTQRLAVVTEISEDHQVCWLRMNNGY